MPTTPTIDEKKLLDFILGEADDAVKNRSAWESLHDEYVKRFEALRSVMALDTDIIDRPWRGSANIGIPLEATAVYTLLARFVRAIFGVKPILLARPTGASDVEKAPLIERYMQWELTERMRVFMDLYLALEGSLVGGSRVGKTLWEDDVLEYPEDTCYLVNAAGQPLPEPGGTTPLEVEATHAPVTDPLTGQVYTPQPAQAIRRTVIYRGPRLYVRPIKQIIVSQDADHPDPNRLDWIIDEYWQTFQWFRAKGGMLADGVLDKLKGLKDAKRSREGDRLPKVPGIQPRQQTSRFHVYEWHGRFADDEGEEHELIALVLPDEKLLAGWMPNQFYRKTGRRQFVHWCPIPRPHSFYGRGVCEMLRGIRAVLDAYTKQGIDRGFLFNNPPTLYNHMTSGFDPGRHKFGTGVSWGLRDINAVKLMELPRREDVGLQREETLFALVQRLLGVNDFNFGASRTIGLPTQGAASNTASGIQALLGESNIRFEMMIKLIQEWTHPEFARQIFYHNRFNVTQEETFAVLEDQDNPFQRIGPEVLDANPDFVFQGNMANTNKGQEREDALGLLEMAVKVQNPYLVADQENYRALTQRVLRTYDYQEIRLKSFDAIRAQQQQRAVQDQQAAFQQQVQQRLQLAGLTRGALSGGVPTNGNGHGRLP